MVTIRQASIFDVELVVPLFDAYRQFYRKPSDPDLAYRFLFDRVRHDQSIVFIAEQPDGSTVGFAQLFPSFSSASAARIYILNDLFVAPEFRRQGIGAQLLDEAARFGRAAGAVRLTLSTEVTNQSAQALYEARGWVRQTEFYVYNLTLGG